MAQPVERFEDLLAWQRARELHRQLQIELQKPAFRHAFGLRRQLEDAAASAMGNIAEGRERSGIPEFAHGLSIAKGSAGEVRSHLYAALDAGYLSPEAFQRLRGLAEETSRLIAALRASLLRRQGPR